MSKIIRKFRQIKKKARLATEYTPLSYPKIHGTATGTVLDIVHERGRGAPYAVVQIKGDQYNLPATEGMYVGKEFTISDKEVPISFGNITRLKNIPEGYFVNSIESEHQGVGYYAATAGSYSIIVNHRAETNQTVVKLPSGVKKLLNSDLMAMIGIVSSGGITFKPILKAGNAHYLKKSRGQLYPRVRGVAMNPVDHPHGGGNHQHIGFPCTISKKAPYAQQVGLVGARSTGRRTGAKKASR